MKNKRFLSITMVLLTALFVLAFAAVTKNTAMKASAAYGGIDEMLYDIATTSYYCSGCGEYFRDRLAFDNHACVPVSDTGAETAAASSVMTTRRQSTTEPQSSYDEYYTSEDGILSFIIRSDHAIVSRCRENVTGTVEIPATVKGKPVTALAENSFSNCEVSEVIVPDGVIYIGHYAFSYSSIETVSLPSSLEEIGESAFRDCYNLAQITLPEGLEYIGNSAFVNCGKLESIRIPASVKSIGYYAFDCNYYYYGVKSIEVDEGNDGAPEIPERQRRRSLYRPRRRCNYK